MVAGGVPPDSRGGPCHVRAVGLRGATCDASVALSLYRHSPAQQLIESNTLDWAGVRIGMHVPLHMQMIDLQGYLAQTTDY